MHHLDPKQAVTVVAKWRWKDGERTDTQRDRE